MYMNSALDVDYDLIADEDDWDNEETIKKLAYEDPNSFAYQFVQSGNKKRKRDVKAQMKLLDSVAQSQMTYMNEF